MEPKINPKFWLDEDLVDQPAEVRLAVLWMITNPGTDLMGVFTVNPKTFAFQTGLEAAWLERALGAMERILVRVGNKAWLRNYVGYQIGRGQNLANNRNMLKALSKPLGRAPQALQEAFFREYPEALENSSPWVGLPKGFTPAPGLGGMAVDSTGNESLPGRARVAPMKNRTEQNSTEQGGGVGDPLLAEVIAAGSMMNVPAEECRKFYEFYAGLGWMHKGTHIVDWRKWLPRWRENARAFAAEKKMRGGPATVSDQELEDIDAELQWQSDPGKIEALKKRRKELVK